MLSGRCRASSVIQLGFSCRPQLRDRQHRRWSSSGSGSPCSWRASTAASPASRSASPHDTLSVRIAHCRWSACAAVAAPRQPARRSRADARRGAAPEREEKAKQLEPPEPSGSSERCSTSRTAASSSASSIRPKACIRSSERSRPAAGSRSVRATATRRLGGAVDFSTFAMGSFKKYWMVGRAPAAAAAARRAPRSTSHAQTLRLPGGTVLRARPRLARDRTRCTTACATPSSAARRRCGPRRG